MNPDITFTEARNEALATAFDAVDRIVSQSSFEFSHSPFSYTVEGLIISLGLYSSRSEETIYESVHFTWDELLDPTLDLPQLTATRWNEARAATVTAEEKARKEKEMEEKRRRERERREAPAKQEAKEREELKRLMAKYGESKG
jgi:hypothetical protein